MKITAALLYAIAPGARAEVVDNIVANQEVLVSNAIIDPHDVAYFLGQCACETQGFTRLEENLYYTSAKRIKAVWPSRFPTEADAVPFVRNPSALANLVYGGRLGNRPATNDGYAYRGSSCIMTTGRANYQTVKDATGLDVVANPDWLRSGRAALLAACVYWRVHNLKRFADHADVSGLTKAIQGGQAGLADRKAYTERALKWIDGKSSQFGERADWLRNGAKGDKVREAQTFLKLAGFYDDGAIDGVFGPGTENAVRDFQKARGLIADGVVGDATWSALRSVKNIPGETKPNALVALLKALLEVVGKLVQRGRDAKA